MCVFGFWVILYEGVLVILSYNCLFRRRRFVVGGGRFDEEFRVVVVFC